MNIFRGFSHFCQSSCHTDTNVGSVVVVGSFDGVHSGHRRLIADVNELADQLALRSVVVTFDPHPRQVLRGENRLLSTIDERIMLMEQAGVRDLVVVEFTKEFAAIDADSFAGLYLKQMLGAKVVFTGEGHTFGRNRRGDDAVLEKYEIQVRHIARYEDISSTQVRFAVEEGRMEDAAYLLGGHYVVFTPIVEKTKLLPATGRFCCEVDGVDTPYWVDQIHSIKRKSTLLIKKRL